MAPDDVLRFLCCYSKRWPVTIYKLQILLVFISTYISNTHQYVHLLKMASVYEFALGTRTYLQAIGT